MTDPATQTTAANASSRLSSKPPKALTKNELTRKFEDRIARHIFDRAIADYAAQSPQTATRLGVGGPNARWDPADISEIRADILNHYARLLADSVDYDALSPASRNKYDLLMYGASTSRSQAQHENPFNPVSGVQVTWPLFLINMHPAEDRSDFEDYIVRTGKIASGIKALARNTQVHSITRRGAEMVLAQCDGLMAGSPFTEDDYQSVLLEDFDTRTRAAKLPAVGRDELTTEFRSILYAAIIEGCEEIARYLEVGQPERVAPEIAGQTDPAVYQSLLDDYTSTGLTADEVHRLALATAQAQRDQLDELAGLAGVTVAELASDQRFRIGASEAAIQQLLNQVSDHVFDLDAQLGQFTHHSPRTDLYIRAVEPFRRESSDKAAYVPASNSNPAGTMYINPDKIRTWEVFALTCATTIPGAHLMPATRLGDIIPVPAMTEGWALYASQLPTFVGEIDVSQRIGIATLVATSAAKAAVDTGMHALDWSTARAVRYIKGVLPITDDAANDMVTLILATPGRNTAGFVGAHTIEELRDQARAQLKDKFSLQGFHDTLLAQGPMPLPVVQKNIASWIERLESGT